MKKELRLLFLHEFKLGNNAAQTTASINKTWRELQTSIKHEEKAQVKEQ